MPHEKPTCGCYTIESYTSFVPNLTRARCT
jgi:hypothetical protein